jgi:hypothetical protein
MRGPSVLVLWDDDHAIDVLLGLLPSRASLVGQVEEFLPAT